MIDGFIGFGMHIRGIARKPGGWRLPVTNIVMGPPIFSPILFTTSAYLGLLASYLRTEEDLPKNAERPQTSGFARFLPHTTDRTRISLEQDIREGRFQRQLLVVTAISASLSGSEAWYSHYKNGFRYSFVQISPIVLAAALSMASLVALAQPKAITRAVVPLSLLAGIDAAIGTFFHARGIVRRPGGLKYLGYNIMYGPPIFAPLLFGAAGMFGLLASLLRQENP